MLAHACLPFNYPSKPFKDGTGLDRMNTKLVYFSNVNVFHKHWGRSGSPVATLASEDAHAKNEQVEKVYIEVKTCNCNILILFLQSGVYQQL